MANAWKLRQRVASALCLAAAGLGACKQEKVESGSQPDAYFGECSINGCVEPAGTNDTRWQSITQRQSLPVCFEGGGDLDSPERQAIVTGALNTAFGPDVFGFNLFRVVGSCDAVQVKGEMVRVLLSSFEFVQVKDFGSRLDNRPGGVVLNVPWGLAGSCAYERYPHCLWSYTVHEFGHVLGMLHEDARPDSECPMYDHTGGLGVEGGVTLGNYDPDSIMSYCRNYRNLRVEDTLMMLSPQDVAGIAQFYWGEETSPTNDYEY